MGEWCERVRVDERHEKGRQKKKASGVPRPVYFRASQKVARGVLMSTHEYRNIHFITSVADATNDLRPHNMTHKYTAHVYDVSSTKHRVTMFKCHN